MQGLTPGGRKPPDEVDPKARHMVTRNAGLSDSSSQTEWALAMFMGPRHGAARSAPKSTPERPRPARGAPPHSPAPRLKNS